MATTVNTDSLINWDELERTKRLRNKPQYHVSNT